MNIDLFVSGIQTVLIVMAFGFLYNRHYRSLSLVFGAVLLTFFWTENPIFGVVGWPSAAFLVIILVLGISGKDAKS